MMNIPAINIHSWYIFGFDLINIIVGIILYIYITDITKYIKGTKTAQLMSSVIFMSFIALGLFMLVITGIFLYQPSLIPYLPPILAVLLIGDVLTLTKLIKLARQLQKEHTNI